MAAHLFDNYCLFYYYLVLINAGPGNLYFFSNPGYVLRFAVILQNAECSFSRMLVVEPRDLSHWRRLIVSQRLEVF